MVQRGGAGGLGAGGCGLGADVAAVRPDHSQTIAASIARLASAFSRTAETYVQLDMTVLCSYTDAEKSAGHGRACRLTPSALLPLPCREEDESGLPVRRGFGFPLRKGSEFSYTHFDNTEESQTIGCFVDNQIAQLAPKVRCHLILWDEDPLGLHDCMLWHGRTLDRLGSLGSGSALSVDQQMPATHIH